MRNPESSYGIDAPNGASDESDRTRMDAPALRRAFFDHLTFSRGHPLANATAYDRYVALALSVRDRLMRRWVATEQAYADSGAKRVYYLSAEFLLGRALRSNLQALGVERAYRSVLRELLIDLDEMCEQEPEPGLGNGGLGRLAACFLDSMATLALPGQGYGIRYEFGIFEQEIQGGRQIERADEWLRFGNPWEVARPEHAVEVRFGGTTQVVPSSEGGFQVIWQPHDTVVGVPHDVPVAGYRNDTVNALRLWAAKSSREFDFQLFNAGDYVRAVEGKNASEVISKVLYPNDNFEQGRELRLRQEYFFVSCSVQDVVRRHIATYGRLDNFADKVAMQLNDTHPAVAVAELMRVFVDEQRLGWERAWEITQATFGFTNHTLMPEALERWPVALFERILPRHLEIVREIDRRFTREVLTAYPHDRERVQRMAIIDEDDEIHMARLALVGSHTINGVAELHSTLLRERVMKDFAELYPTRFTNKTNGVTPRRWLLGCNPPLASLITERIGDGWATDLDQLSGLVEHIDDAFLERLDEVKMHHKTALAGQISQLVDLKVDPTAIFDVQIKRLHEYKRQLLNLLHIIALYLRARRGETVTPRVFVFGAKAAPGYRAAKEIIELIHAVAEVVNHDPRAPEVRIAFLPNYRVTLAERIIPAADVSEQISTAGFEASGTGNMKLALNGALTIGTLDGANIEIREAVGEDNFFLFGMTEDQVRAHIAAEPAGRPAYEADDELREVVDLIAEGFFSPEQPDRFAGLVERLLDHDEYCVFADYAAYAASQRDVAAAYLDRERWGRMCALNIARIGRFSSDRTIREYAKEIWGIEPVEVRLSE
jgi:glycogen phosphorylase